MSSATSEPIFDDAERQRWDALRDREASGQTLTPQEQEELATLRQRILDYEAAYLEPANERRSAEIRSMREENQILSDILSRKRRLAARLETMLKDLTPSPIP